MTEKDLLNLSRLSAVRIVADNGQSTGTGFLIGKNYIATCFHVIANVTDTFIGLQFKTFDNIEITFFDGKTTKAKLTSIPNSQSHDPLGCDFAILKLESPAPTGAKFLAFRPESTAPEVGDNVIYTGFPLFSTDSLTLKGNVAGFRMNGAMISIQGSINSGNSGGAAIDFQGNAFGIISQKMAVFSKGLTGIEDFIKNNTGNGGVFIQGINPNIAILRLIESLKQNISTGVGFAISTKYINKYINEHKEIKIE